MNDWPHWIEQDADINLRAVANRLYVGAELSPGLRPEGAWVAVIDFYGSSKWPFRRYLYAGAQKVHTIPFLDGDVFPTTALGRVSRIVREALPAGPVLIHCQAGLSRSASAAYAVLRDLGGLDHQTALARVQITPEFPRQETLGSARQWVAAAREKKERAGKAGPPRA